MIKFVALLKKKEGMSREAFIDYYENHHAPFMSETIPSIFEYRRSYVLAEHMFVAGHNAEVAPPPPPFDVITELWFTDMEKYREMHAITAEQYVPVLSIWCILRRNCMHFPIFFHVCKP